MQITRFLCDERTKRIGKTVRLIISIFKFFCDLCFFHKYACNSGYYLVYWERIQ